MFDFRSRSREGDSIPPEPVDQEVALISNGRLRCWEAEGCPESPGGPGPIAVGLFPTAIRPPRPPPYLNSPPKPR